MEPQTLVDGPAANASALLAEVDQLWQDCEKKYKFNAHWDNWLNVIGLALGVAIVSAGVLLHPRIAAVLGAFVSAIVTAQRAFPFGQRALFYRVLVSHSRNLQTQIQEGELATSQAVAALMSLRVEYAQQFPKGSSFGTDTGPTPQTKPERLVPRTLRQEGQPPLRS